MKRVRIEIEIDPCNVAESLRDLTNYFATNPRFEEHTINRPDYNATIEMVDRDDIPVSNEETILEDEQVRITLIKFDWGVQRTKYKKYSYWNANTNESSYRYVNYDEWCFPYTDKNPDYESLKAYLIKKYSSKQ